MKQLLLVRHGKTDWNAAQRLQGQADVPLNAAGEQQAEAVARRLADEAIDVIYASDLQRAWVTAETIERHWKMTRRFPMARHFPMAHHHTAFLHAEPRLREISYGDWQGLTYAEMQIQFSEQFLWWNENRMHHAPPNGETLTQLATRLQLLLDEVNEQHADQTVLFVTHGGTICVLLCLLLNKSPAEYRQFRMGNTAFSRFSFSPRGAQLVQYNDTHHLAS